MPLAAEKSVLDKLWIVGFAGCMEGRGLNFIAQVSGTIWQHIDFGTVIVCLMACLMLAAGFYDRNRKGQSGIIIPLIAQLEALIRALRDFMISHDSKTGTQDALHAKDHSTIIAELGDIKTALNTILLHINGSGRK